MRASFFSAILFLVSRKLTSTDSLKERRSEGDISKKKEKEKSNEPDTVNDEVVLVIRQLFGASLARWRSND